MNGDAENRYWCRAAVTEARLLVDGAAYYRALYEAATRATHSVMILAWQFDPGIELIRGAGAASTDYPVGIWEFLNALCERKPELNVYILAWDYSLVYAFERTWLAMAEARLRAHARLQFRWRAHPDPRGSHHQKLVVIDGHLAFVGGLDLGRARWDTPSHDPENPHRLKGFSTYTRPFHDLQVAVRGPIASRLEALFEQAWQSSEGVAELPPTKPPGKRLVEFDLGSLCANGLPLGAGDVAISRTIPPEAQSPAVQEVRNMYEWLLHHAERLVYIETQYFTSSAVYRALLKRMHDGTRPKLTLVVVMPDGADSAKEQFALGHRQDQVLAGIRSNARELGHDVLYLHSATRTSAGERLVTYVHSKLMIVDDRHLLIGSANLTNRSMGLDTELTLTWNEDSGSGGSDLIRRARAALLAEHVGVEDVERFIDSRTLKQTLVRACRAPQSRLLEREVPSPVTADPLVTAIFDPKTAFQHQDWDRVWEEVLGADDPNLLKRSWQAVKRMLAKP